MRAIQHEQRIMVKIREAVNAIVAVGASRAKLIEMRGHKIRRKARVAGYAAI